LITGMRLALTSGRLAGSLTCDQVRAHRAGKPAKE
jgi:hypothetical protein